MSNPQDVNEEITRSDGRGNDTRQLSPQLLNEKKGLLMPEAAFSSLSMNENKRLQQNGQQIFDKNNLGIPHKVKEPYSSPIITRRSSRRSKHTLKWRNMLMNRNMTLRRSSRMPKKVEAYCPSQNTNPEPFYMKTCLETNKGSDLAVRGEGSSGKAMDLARRLEKIILHENMRSKVCTDLIKIEEPNMFKSPDTLAAPGHVIKKIEWGKYPPLRNLLVNKRKEFFELSVKKEGNCDYNKKLTTYVKNIAERHNWTFEQSMTDKTIRDKIRCFYKTLTQNMGKRLDRRIMNPKKQKHADFLLKHESLIKVWEEECKCKNQSIEGDMDQKQSQQHFGMVVEKNTAETQKPQLSSRDYQDAILVCSDFQEENQRDKTSPPQEGINDSAPLQFASSYQASQGQDHNRLTDENDLLILAPFDDCWDFSSESIDLNENDVSSEERECFDKFWDDTCLEPLIFTSSQKWGEWGLKLDS